MSDGIKVVSVDLFDTLVTRRVAHPSDAFVLLGRRLAEQGLVELEPSAFGAMRSEVEASSRAIAPGGEVTLAEIHGEILRRLSRDRLLVDRFVAEELAVETAIIVLVPGAIEWLRGHKLRGRRVICMTDTYLPGSWIWERIRDLGLSAVIDAVHVSCEARASKASGDLFERVLKLEQVQPSEVLHVGDDRRADAERPREWGLQVSLATSAALNRYERAVATGAPAGDPVPSLLAAAMRYARLASPAGSERATVSRDVACGVIVPLAVSFAIWVLRRADAQGCDRLYFVSRDGWRPFLAAKQLHKLFPLPGLELRYLLGSRQAWHQAALAADPGAAMSWLADAQPGMTAGMLLDRAVGSASDVRGLVDDVDKVIEDPSEIRVLARALLGAPDVLDSSTRARDLVMSYLEHAGVCDALRPVFVDVGWTGRQFRSLDLILDRVAPERRFLLFGLTQDAAKCAPGSAEAFAFDHRTGVGTTVSVGEMQLLEYLFAAPHGRLLGFRSRTPALEPEPAFGPISAQPVAQEVLDEGLEVGAAFFVESCLRLGVTAQDLARANLAGVALAGFRELFRRPSRAEARALGRLSETSDQLHTGKSELAPPMTVGDLVPSRLRRPGLLLSRAPRAGGHWPAASAQRVSGVGRAALRSKAVLRRMGRRPIRRVHLQGPFIDSQFD